MGKVSKQEKRGDFCLCMSVSFILLQVPSEVTFYRQLYAVFFFSTSTMIIMHAYEMTNIH